MGVNLAGVAAIASQYGKVIKETMAAQSALAQKGAADMAQMANSLMDITGKAKMAKIALQGVADAVKTAVEQTAQKGSLQNAVNSDQVGGQLYQYVSEYAALSALGREDLTAATGSFLGYTRDIEQVEELIQLTERLYAKAPNKGGKATSDALSQALLGDTSGMQNEFGIGGIDGAMVSSMASQGDMAGAIDYLSEAMNTFGATQQAVERNFGTLTTQSTLFSSNLASTLGDAAMPIMENLTTLFMNLNANMAAGLYEPFFNVMSAGMNMMGEGIAFVAENIDWLVPILAGLVFGLIAYEVATMAAVFWTLMQGISFAAVTGNIPAIIGLIGGVTLAAGGLAKAFSEIDNKITPKIDPSELQKGLDGTTLGKGKVGVETSKQAPRAAKAEGDIEKENLKYLIDMAGAKFLAKFSTATLAPQVNIYGQTIEKTTDLSEVTGYLTNKIVEMTDVSPQGAY